MLDLRGILCADDLLDNSGEMFCQSYLYFLSSIFRYVAETCCLYVLQIVKNRVARHLVRPTYHWNSVPGAHVVLPEWSDIPNNFPFYYKTFGETPGDHFTAVIYATSAVTASSPLFRVLKVVAKSQYCQKVG